jgi:hypothetical protein
LAKGRQYAFWVSPVGKPWSIVVSTVFLVPIIRDGKAIPEFPPKT